MRLVNVVFLLTFMFLPIHKAIATSCDNEKDYGAAIKCLEDKINQVTQNISQLPKGTIIPWDPVIRTPTGEPTVSRLDIPAGWKICGTTPSTPNLDDKFLMGTSSLQQAGNTGGVAEIAGGQHKHSGTTDPVNADRNRPCDGNCYPPSPSHNHKFTTDDGGTHSHGDNRPPFLKIIFLCKLLN